MGFATMIQTSHLLLISFQKTTFDKGRYRLKAMALVQELVTGYLRKVESGKRKEITIFARFCSRSILFPLSTFLFPLNKIKKVDERRLLLRSPRQHIEGNMKGLLATELRRQADTGLRLRLIAVFCFQTSGQCRLIDLSYRRHIIVGYPLPKTKLRIQQNRGGIQNLKDVLYLELTGKRPFVRLGYDTNIRLATAKGHKHAFPYLYLFCCR